MQCSCKAKQLGADVKCSTSLLGVDLGAEIDIEPCANTPHAKIEVDFDGSDATYPFGSHVAVVEIDRETGRVDLIRHIAVDDCGTILNPMLVNGQQHGGIAQGIGQALWEHVRYDEDANPVTASLMDYLMPSAAEFPSFEVSNTETASPRNPSRAGRRGNEACARSAWEGSTSPR